jgi:hypothetical protein
LSVEVGSSQTPSQRMEFSFDSVKLQDPKQKCWVI